MEIFGDRYLCLGTIECVVHDIGVAGQKISILEHSVRGKPDLGHRISSYELLTDVFGKRSLTVAHAVGVSWADS